MEQATNVVEYKCPNCGAGLHFGQENQNMTCEYCLSQFDIEQVLEHNAKFAVEEAFEWDPSTTESWNEAECGSLKSFVCPSCGGEIVTEETTAATFCPYCGNPSILPGRVSGGLKPDGVIPFKTGKDDAKAAFLNLCKGKPLLPRAFLDDHQVEKITGMYVPFWLYDCQGDFKGQYKTTRVHSWSDRNYNYIRTEHFLVIRAADAGFTQIPMDASRKMDNAIMESIEPFDYSQMLDFETAYLSGYLADKYDVEAAEGQERIRSRVDSSMNSLINATILGYHTVLPISKQLNVRHGKAKYVLLPVWMLHTKYQDKTYVFAMNGQTGKMTGTFPICPRKTAMWFGGIWAGVTAALTLLLHLLG